jgi:hypothetical protein
LFVVVEVIDSIQPSHGADFGSSVVRFHGKGFIDSPLLLCLFGSVTVSAVWLQSDLVECQSPPMVAGTDVVVRIANNGVDFSETFTIFQYRGMLIFGADKKHADICF